MNGVGVYLILVLVSRSGNWQNRFPSSEYLPHPQHGGSYFLVEGLIPYFLCIMSFTADVKVNVFSLRVFAHILLMLTFNSLLLFTRILTDTHWLSVRSEHTESSSRTFKRGIYGCLVRKQCRSGKTLWTCIFMFFFQPKPTTVEILEGIDKVGAENAASTCTDLYLQCVQVL